MSEAILTVDKASVHYGGVKAVDDVSLTVEVGEICGLLGPNGSGKTTLLGALTRLVDLTSGQIWVDGRSLASVKPSEVLGLGISRTFQTVRLLDALTVAENILLGCDSVKREARRGMAARNNRKAFVSELCDRVGISGTQNARPGSLPYGHQRRVEIARALASRPRLLILDEPTAGMTRSERAEISGLMMELRTQGVTQLVVEHDVEMMVETCDHVVALNAGRLLCDGSPGKVVADPNVRAAYLGSAHADG